MSVSPPADFPRFPPGFVFGASTASYQIEGAVDEDGRGPTVWDTFANTPGTIIDGSTGAVACDHYHRWAEDVALLGDLGAGGYRFSIAWSRIQPTGSGAVEPRGLDFYERLVDALLAAGVAPFATLFHWDLPQALEDAGGWLNRDTALRFAEYTDLVAARLADRVAMWAPVNEPNVHTILGHALGIHAPGRTLMLDALPVAHHLMLGHGLAVQALRAHDARAVGSANNHTPVWRASDDPADVEAAAFYDDFWNHLFADPILRGTYPERFAARLPVEDGDLELIKAPLDFYGLNYYNPTSIGAAIDEQSALGGRAFPPGLPYSQRRLLDYPQTAFDWPVIPDGLRELLVGLKARYPDLPPAVITENGASYAIGPDAEGRVADTDRIAYLDSHLRAVHAAIEQGVDVTGYFTWSLMDNFEWAEGFGQRFGLVWIDYATQQRIPKDSYHWYAAVIAAHHAQRTE